MAKKTNIFEVFKDKTIPLLNMIVIIFAIIGGIILIDNRVENAVYEILHSKEFINEIISQTHPSIIFDENESILNDIGGMNYHYCPDVEIIKGI